MKSESLPLLPPVKLIDGSEVLFNGGGHPRQCRPDEGNYGIVVAIHMVIAGQPEIVAQHLEKRLGEKVDRKLNLGGTLLAHEALVKGSIDVYPEYTGTALTNILKLPPSSDAAAVLETVALLFVVLGSAVAEVTVAMLVMVDAGGVAGATWPKI